MISVLTPTGGRPEAFAACVEMMRVQTYAGKIRWVIVDDGPEETYVPDMPENWELIHLRPFPRWSPGDNTQARNMLLGLHHAGDRVAIVEDDDEYASWWLERCNEWLDQYDLVGEGQSLYRHRVSGREKQMMNTEHASMCSTAMKGAAIEALRAICQTKKTALDLTLWRTFRGSKWVYPPEPRGVTGIKGWPGRAGIGMGHRRLA